MRTAESIAHALEARRVGPRWMARCPSHKDRNPSLAISDIDGKVVFKCFAGCSQERVMEALRSRGLWGNSDADYVLPPDTFSRTSTPKRRDWGPIVAEYDYTDEQGVLLYTICRFYDKQFRPRLPDGRWGYHGTRRVLYRLRELTESPICFVVEGERDVESLRARGFVATSNPGGANGWRREFAESLRGRECNLIPDDDPPGWQRVLHIARDLIGVAARIRILELTDGAKDVTEWFEKGHSEVELIAMLEGCQHAA